MKEGTGEQERCIAVDFLKIKMLLVIKKVLETENN